MRDVPAGSFHWCPDVSLSHKVGSWCNLAGRIHTTYFTVGPLTRRGSYCAVLLDQVKQRPSLASFTAGRDGPSRLTHAPSVNQLLSPSWGHPVWGGDTVLESLPIIQDMCLSRNRPNAQATGIVAWSLDDRSRHSGGYQLRESLPRANQVLECQPEGREIAKQLNMRQGRRHRWALYRFGLRASSSFEGIVRARLKEGAGPLRETAGVVCAWGPSSPRIGMC